MQVVAVDLKALTKMRMGSLANINISLVVADTINGKLKAPAAKKTGAPYNNIVPIRPAIATASLKKSSILWPASS
jgi:hypothetical protein